MLFVAGSWSGLGSGRSDPDYHHFLVVFFCRRHTAPDIDVGPSTPPVTVFVRCHDILSPAVALCPRAGWYVWLPRVPAACPTCLLVTELVLLLCIEAVCLLVQWWIVGSLVCLLCLSDLLVTKLVVYSVCRAPCLLALCVVCYSLTYLGRADIFLFMHTWGVIGARAYLSHYSGSIVDVGAWTIPRTRS